MAIKVEEKYDLEHPVVSKEKALQLANYVVHSFVFCPGFDDNGKLIAVLFNSDRTRGKTLYEIAITELVGFFRDLGLDDPATMTAWFDTRKGDYVVHVGASQKL